MPTPNFIKHRRSTPTSSLVQPGEGVKFHNERASPIFGPASSAIVTRGGVKGATSANARDEVLRLLEGAREFQNPRKQRVSNARSG